jgi:multimeric flavodoxin WrbA
MARRDVVIVIGSPRENGNSAALALQAADGVRKAGGEPQVFRIADMDLRPCRACDTCQKKKNYSCVINDDMRLLYPVLRRARGLLIASPVYWFSVSAQTKLFMDRLYAFVGPKGHGLKGRKMGVILIYGDVDPFTSGAVNALRMFQDSFAYIGAPVEGMVYGSANAAGEVNENKALLREAAALGRRLAGGE